MIDAIRSTCEYYMILSKVHNEANSYSVRDAALKEGDHQLVAMVDGGDPKERAFYEEVEEALEDLKPADDCDPDDEHPLNDWMVEECGGGDLVHYLWFNIYAKYDNVKTWKMIRAALGLNEAIYPHVEEVQS